MRSFVEVNFKVNFSVNFEYASGRPVLTWTTADAEWLLVPSTFSLSYVVDLLAADIISLKKLVPHSV